VFMAIGLISFFATGVFVILGIISAIKKKGNLKKNLLFAAICFVVLIIAVASDPSPSKTTTAAAEEDPKVVDNKTSAPKQTEDPAIKKAEEDKKAKELAAAAAMAELKKQQEAEIKKKEAAAEAKRKENTIDGNGTFAVNNEVKPGLYRADGGITYWARTKGFSGDLNEMLANGIPSGPAIVEIKTTDVGFQTKGSGTWTLVDDSYAPELLSEFSDGMYLVGKDISPGTYKSDDSVTYWARLANFAGDMNSIAANGIPAGPEIVEIKANDKGFVTSGGGTWKKIK
jgi:hypothetical protein